MITYFSQDLRFYGALSLVGASLLAASLVGCQSDSDMQSDTGAPPIIDIQAAEYAFAAPDTVPSGWVTFRMTTENATEIHDLVLRRLPKGRYEDVPREVHPAQDSIMELVQAGEITSPEEYRALQKRLYPEWVFNEVTSITDRGWLSPGRSARKTVHLEPGTHQMSCFVKAPNGKTHGMNGMRWRFVATEDSTGATPPEPDVDVVVSEDSIAAPDTVAGSTLSVAARLGGFPERSTIHLVRIPDTSTQEEVARWVDFFRPKGVMSPAPAEFLGGFGVFSRKPRENPAYFTAEDVDPGIYHWMVTSFSGSGHVMFEPLVVE